MLSTLRKLSKLNTLNTLIMNLSAGDDLLRAGNGKHGMIPPEHEAHLDWG